MRKNEGFQTLIKELAAHLLTNKPANVEEAMAQTMENGKKVEEHINEAIAKIGEKTYTSSFRNRIKKLMQMHSALTYTWVDALVY